jgi:hypothetical protein
MLHVSAITAIIRQNIYKSVRRTINIYDKIGFSLTIVVILVCILS